MSEIYIDPNKCEVCCECINICSTESLGLIGGKVKQIDATVCTLCEECYEICGNVAIEVIYDIGV